MKRNMQRKFIFLLLYVLSLSWVACAPTYISLSAKRVFQDPNSSFRQVEYLPSFTSIVATTEQGIFFLWKLKNESNQPFLSFDLGKNQVLPAEATSSSVANSAFATNYAASFPSAMACFSSKGDAQTSLLAISSKESGAFFLDSNQKLASLETKELSLLDKLRTVGKEDKVAPPVYSPSGNWVAIPSNYNTVRIWDTHTKKLMKHLVGEGLVYGVAFSPNEKQLATAGGDGSVQIWDLALEKPIHTWKSNGGEMRAVLFSIKGDTLIGGGEFGHLVFWDVATKTEQGSFPLYQGPIQSLSLSSSGNNLLIVKEFGTAEVWDVNTRTRRFRLKGHQGRINSAQFSKDGKWIVSTSDDQTALVWDVKAGKAKWLLKGHQAKVTSAVFFQPDGEKNLHIATASQDGTIRLWKLPS